LSVGKFNTVYSMLHNEHYYPSLIIVIYC